MPTIDRRTAASIATLAALAFLCWFAIGCGRDDDQSTGEPNSEATLAAVVTEISATQEAASQAATPTPATTDAPGVSSTTEGFTPIRTPLTNAATGSDPLTLLLTTDRPGVVLGRSVGDRKDLPVGRGLARPVDGPGQFTGIGYSGLVTDEERLALIGCLEDDTMLRLFLTPVLTATGPLSAESWVCLRSGLADTDVGALMLATTGEPGANPNAEAAMAAAMVSSMVSLSCLNEAEFQTAGPTMGIDPEEYGKFQCVLQEVGGPEKMAELMQPDPGFPAALFEAAFDCQAQISGTPPS